MYHVKYGLAGPQRLDQVNLRHCAAIIGIFGIITIISYFNELAKQGLLTGSPRHYYAREFEVATVTAHIKRGPDQIDIDLGHLKSVIRRNMSRKTRNVDDGAHINIALHLGRNNSYEGSQNSPIKMLIYQNVMPNFFQTVSMWKNDSVTILQNSRNQSKLFLTECNIKHRRIMKREKANIAIDSNIPSAIKEELCKQEAESVKQKEIEIKNVYRNITKTSDYKKLLHSYSHAVQVFVYQHEAGGYLLRDCFKKLTKQAGLNLLNSPLNQVFRQEWAAVSNEKQRNFEALFGSLSFGVCETFQRPCLYSAMLAHPLDRILQVYFQCRQDNSSNVCNFYRSSNITQGNLHGFINMMGNSFFKKLIYHSKQCRLVGDDEICIQDNKASFILTQKERQSYLNNVLNNLDKWFGVVGVVDHYTESLQLFQHVTGLNFTTCPAITQSLVPKKYKKLVKSHNDPKKVEVLYEDLMLLKSRLLNDSQVIQWIYADLAIYNKMEDIFKKQWKVFQELQKKNIKKNSKKPTVLNKAGNQPLAGRFTNSTTKLNIDDKLITQTFSTYRYNLKAALKKSNHKKKAKHKQLNKSHTIERPTGNLPKKDLIKHTN